MKPYHHHEYHCQKNLLRNRCLFVPDSNRLIGHYYPRYNQETRPDWFEFHSLLSQEHFPSSTAVETTDQRVASIKIQGQPLSRHIFLEFFSAREQLFFRFEVV